MAIAILKDGSYLFDCWRKNSSTNISSNGTYQTGIHYCEIYNSGSYSTEARLKINGQWQTYDSQSFTVHDQQNVTVYDFWRQSDPIYASNQNGQNNFEAQFKIRNNGSSSFTVDDIAIHVLKDSVNLFDCWRKNSSTTIAGNSSYETGRHFCEIYNSGSYSTEARLMINGQWNTYESLSFTVLDEQSSFPDLVVESPSVDDNTLSPGENYQIFATVRNAGTASSSATTLRYYLSSNSTITTGDSEIGTDTVDALSAGGTSPEDKGNRNAPTAPGTYWVGACVDSVSGESNTGNNCSSGVQISVSNPTYPDLIVQSPTVSDSTLTSGQSFIISAIVRNQGNAPSSSTTLRYYRSTNSTISTGDTQLSIDGVSALSPNGTSSESDSVTAPSSTGTYWIGACVNSVSGESNTGNNCSSGVQITVSNPAYPDLIVQSPSVSDSTLTPGQSFTVSAIVRNQGAASSSSTTLRYYRSNDSTISTGDTQLSTDGVSALLPNGTSAESNSVTAPSSTGTYWVGACVDSVSGESNTGNNCSNGIHIKVDVEQPSEFQNIVPILQLLLLDATKPDLLIEELSLITSPYSSYDIYYKFTVKNIGSSPVLISNYMSDGSYNQYRVTIQAFVSNGTISRPSGGRVLTLSPGFTLKQGESITGEFGATVDTNGMTELLLIVDYSEHIDEANENNNTKKTPLN